MTLSGILSRIRFRPTTAYIPSFQPDLRVLDAGIEYDATGNLEYYWFDLVETLPDGSQRRVYRVASFIILKSLPKNLREQGTLVTRTQKMLRGLGEAYRNLSARSRTEGEPVYVHLLQLAANTQATLKRGLIQMYGAHVETEVSRDVAVKYLASAMAALEGAFANFEQAEFVRPDPVLAEWLRQAIEGMPLAVAVVGQPDPRENPRGGDGTRFSAQAHPATYMSLQQNEMLFRAMAQAGEDFVQLCIASPVDREDVLVQQQRVAEEASLWRSRVQGARSIGFSVALPLMWMQGVGDGAGTSYGTGETHGHSQVVQEAVSRAHTVSRGEADSWGHGGGESETWGEATTTGVARGTSTGTSNVEGHAFTRSWGESSGRTWSTSIGKAHSVSDAVSRSTSEGWSESRGGFSSQAVGHTWSHSVTDGSSHTTGTNTTSSWSDTSGSGTSSSNTLGGGVSGGLPFIKGNIQYAHGWGSNQFNSHTEGGATTNVNLTTNSHAETHTTGGSVTHVSGSSWSSGHTWGVSQGTTHTEGVTTSETTTQGGFQSSSRGGAETKSVADGTFRSQSVVHSEAHTVSHARSVSRFWSRGHTVSHGESDTTGHSSGRSEGSTFLVARGRAQSFTHNTALGMSVGLVPAVSFNRSYQTVDHPARIVAEALEEQLQHLDGIVRDGVGFLVDHYILTRTARGQATAEAAVLQAFHGTEGVVTPVHCRRLTPEENDYVRLHAMTFTPSLVPETNPFALEPFRHSSLLSVTQAAAYLTPGAYEEGFAITVQSGVPPFAVYTDMTGPLDLGFFRSFERGTLARTPFRVRLPEVGDAHWLIAADTGFGKSVAAIRLVKEFCEHEPQRPGQEPPQAIFFEPKTGARALLAHIRDAVLYSLGPSGPNPLSFNVLAVNPFQDPETTAGAIAAIFAMIGGIGPRQYLYLVEAIEGVYREYGVMVHEEGTWTHPVWGKVRDDDLQYLNDWRRRFGLPERSSGLRLADLEPWELNIVAAYRSHRCTMKMVYDALTARLKAQQKRRQSGESIEGLIGRVRQFVQGAAGRMYGQGGGISLTDLPQKLVIFEAGGLNDFQKNVLFALLNWHLYYEADGRYNLGYLARRKRLIVIEEANAVMPQVPRELASGAAADVNMFANMARQARKLQISYVYISQHPHLLQEGIPSSCNTLVVGQLKEPKARDLIVAHEGFNEKGLVNTPYLEVLSTLPQAVFIGKFGLTFDRTRLHPFLFTPDMVPAAEFSNAQVRDLMRLRGYLV